MIPYKGNVIIILKNSILSPFRKDEKAQTKLKKLQEHDQIKDNYCKNNNIKLLRIKYTEFNNNENILQASI